ncbi:MAG: iron donor protein CyaY [Candidatus Berkiella sp.]
MSSPALTDVSIMNEQQYHQTVDTLFLKIEAWLEDSDEMVDFDSQEGILTITFEQGDCLILSRQAALQEVWLASKQGAFHFRLHQEGWVTKHQQTLAQVLADCAKDAGLVLDVTKMTI